jgi:hypothetical protein
VTDPSAAGRPHADVAGAIYGSLLAASTIVGTSATATVDTKPWQLAAALVVTSAVFWLMHAYVRAVGIELPTHGSWARALRQGAREELPILAAVVPPLVAIAVAVALDEIGDRVGWIALWASLGGLVFWTWLAVRRAHANRGVAIASLVVSLLLGLVLVELKVWLNH